MKIDIYFYENDNVSKRKKLPSYYLKALNEYIKRLSPHLKINLIMKDFDIKKQKSNARFIKINKAGESFSSEELARWFERLCTSGVSDFIFIFDENNICDLNTESVFNLKLTDADISIPLQIVLLYEQIYRVIKIINNEPYHR